MRPKPLMPTLTAMSVFSFVAGAAMVFELVVDSSSGVFESPAENRLAGNSTKLMIVTLQGPEDEI
jgi:hypothetical protein